MSGINGYLFLAAGVALVTFAWVIMAKARRHLHEAQAVAQAAAEARQSLGPLEKLAQKNAEAVEANRALERANTQLKAKVGELVCTQENLEKRMQVFIDLSQSLTGTLDLKTLLASFLRKLHDIVPFHAAGVFLFNRDKTDMFLAASDGLYRDEMASQLSSDMGIPPIVAQTGKSMLFSDISSDPRFAHIVHSTRLRSALYQPIVENKQVYGVISLSHIEPGAYSDKDLAQLSTVTVEAARAIHNAEVYQELDSRLNFIVTLWETSKHLNTSSIETDSRAWQNVLGEVVTSSRDLFGAEKSVLFRYTSGPYEDAPPRSVDLVAQAGGYLHAVLAHGINGESLAKLQGGINQTNADLPKVFNSTFQIRDLQKDNRFASVHGVAGVESLHGMLWAPLTGRQRALGALALFATVPRTWTQMEMQWLDIFANIFSVTLENVHLFQNLDLEKSHLQVLIDNVPEGVFTTDTEGRILTWNVAAQNITAFTPNEVLGHPCSEFIRCQTVDEVWCRERCPIRLAMDARKNIDSGLHNVVILRKSGDKVPVFITSGPMFNDEGDVTGSILVFRDITKEKEIEQMKEDFLATITHDLKSPLASVMGYAELLLHPKVGDVTPAQKEFVESILRSSKTLQFLIDNILETTRMEAGQMVLKPAIFNLGALIAEIEEMFLPLAAPKSLKLIHTVQDPVVVRGDRGKLKEVFINLYSNAVKFTRPGGSITTQVEVTDDRAVVRVSDTGKGIPASQISRLFEKFAQIESDQKRGTGLGLYIVQRIIQAHGEKIDVTSEEGVGTTFSFGLPRVSPEQNGKGQRTALILERDEETSDEVQRTLEEGGIRTTLASSAREALQAVREWKPDLLIVDSQLPEVISDNLLDEMKALSRAQAPNAQPLRVLMVCDVSEGPCAEADGQIYRPLDLAELLGKARDLIQY